MKLFPYSTLPSAALLAVLLSCTGDSPTQAGRTPTQLQAAGGARTGTVGTALAAPLVVRATDAAGRGVRGVAVSWSTASGGGMLSAASSVTDAAGEARTQWTLGPRAGEQGVTATVQGLAPVLLTATAAPAAPANLQVTGGDPQFGIVGTAMAPAPTVRVTDLYANPVQGVDVTWVVTAGGGSVSPSASRTDSAGNATTRWMMGPAVGANGLSAAVSGLPAAVFTVAATPPPVAARVEKSGGDVQTGVVGEALGDSLAVRVVSAEGRPVPGVTVTWSTAEGALSSTSKPTDATGISRVRWTLGGSAGTQGVEARAAGLAGSPVVFRAAGKAGKPASVKKFWGDGQRGTVGLDLPQWVEVEVHDRYGNPVGGVPVTWTAAGGGALAANTPSTYSSGRASAVWKLGPAEGSQTATATVDGMKVEFTATGVPFAPVSSIRIDRDSFTAGEGTTFNLLATLLDAAGNTLGSRPVAWTSSDPGIVSVTSSASSPTYSTGTALAPGRATITASIDGRSASIVVTVVTAPRLTGFARMPATVDVTSSAATVEFTVSATDAGNGVGSVGVTLRSQTRSVSCTATAPSSGTPTNGTWKCSVTVPQGVDTETWIVSGITLVVGPAPTYMSIYVGYEKLVSQGYPVSVAVTNSGPAATRPALTGFSFSPETVDVTHSNGRVEFTLSASASAGVSSISAGGSQTVNGVTYGVSCNQSTLVLVSGTAASGTWKCSLSVPMNYPSGTWSVGVGITDNTGIQRFYDAEALRNAGLPSTFVVTRSSADAAARRSSSRPAPRPGS